MPTQYIAITALGTRFTSDSLHLVIAQVAVALGINYHDCVTRQIFPGAHVGTFQVPTTAHEWVWRLYDSYERMDSDHDDLLWVASIRAETSSGSPQ